MCVVESLSADAQASRLSKLGIECATPASATTRGVILSMLKLGDPAPDFELPALAGGERITIRSRDYLGRENLVVTFHPLDWTPT